MELAKLVVVTMLEAPKYFASCIPVVPVPPEPPKIRTVEFIKVRFLAPPYHASALIEVSETFGRESASQKFTLLGIKATCVSNTTAYSA